MNLRKLNLGLVALLLGFGLVMTQSAFTEKKKTVDEWGQYTGPTTDDLEEGKWYKSTDIPPDHEAVCNAPQTNSCRYEFMGDPNNGGTPGAGSAQLGVFDIIEL